MKAHSRQEDIQTAEKENEQEARDLNAERQEFERMLKRQSEASRIYLAGKFKVA